MLDDDRDVGGCRVRGAGEKRLLGPHAGTARALALDQMARCLQFERRDTRPAFRNSLIRLVFPTVNQRLSLMGFAPVQEAGCGRAGGHILRGAGRGVARGGQ